MLGVAGVLLKVQEDSDVLWTVQKDSEVPSRLPTTWDPQYGLAQPARPVEGMPRRLVRKYGRLARVLSF